MAGGQDPRARRLAQDQLSAAALAYNVDMACNDRTDPVRHTDSIGGRLYDRFAAQGYNWSVELENVAFGNPRYGRTPQDVLDSWMASQIHRNNLLNPQIMEIGIAFVFTSTSEYGGYYTADFASPN